ncbi:hypothetical protein FEM48_Zijuj05G0190100 [Ziziphus jujuba var. spinosa]|uniref:Uncharacterized protein n=1 Tax=Ziziphus jujuba var. spinosa TaxID=714518 RepID=A0A978VGK7_ZIZJJ|nr:hypothetical protein FEM48_Zijuj05G0190100 [Ziziphus jujuba var. spinosa]
MGRLQPKPTLRKSNQTDSRLKSTSRSCDCCGSGSTLFVHHLLSSSEQNPVFRLEFGKKYSQPEPGILASSTGWLIQADARGCRRTRRLPSWTGRWVVTCNFEYAALDSDDLLYLKEQMEAEEDAERLLRRTEKRAFAAFKISFNGHKAASLADSSPATVPLPLRVEPKPKSGIRQQDLLKKVVEVKPKRPRVTSPSDGNRSASVSNASTNSTNLNSKTEQEKGKYTPDVKPNKENGETKVENPVKSLLGLAYASSDDED